MAIDIGRIAYQAYLDSRKEQDTMTSISYPKWEEIGQVQQNAWRHSAVAVLVHIEKEQENYFRELNLERDLSEI